MFKKFIFTLLCLGFGISSASAENKPSNELGLLLGVPVTPALRTSGQTKIKFGSGVTFQATYARHLIRFGGAAIYFEVPFAAAPNIDISSINNSVPANFASLFITPGLRVKLYPDARVAPWFSIGGGYARFHESADLQNGNSNSGRIGTNRGAAQFGGGVDFHTPFKGFFPIGLRLELRDFYSALPNYNVPLQEKSQHNLLFSGGLVVRF